MCLDVANASNADNANVQQYPCQGTANQRWYLQPDNPYTPTYYYIKSLQSHKCLDIAGAVLGNGGNAQQYGCIGVTNQRWQISAASAATTDWFYVKSVNSGRCLTVAGASTSSNANVDQYDCVNQDNQRWRWNFYVEKHVERVAPQNAWCTSSTFVSDADWNRNFDTARSLYRPFGINLVHTSSDRVTYCSDALFNLGVNDSTSYPDCPVGPGSWTPLACADWLEDVHLGKIITVISATPDGQSNGDQNFIQLANGSNWGDQCPPGSCPTSANDNTSHIAHELGHYLGLPHTQGTDDSGDDWLQGTAPHPTLPGDQCDAQGPSRPAVGNNVMSYYFPCVPEISTDQGIIARITAMARWAGPLQ
jgi:hypothetical protein